jgi:hypothetical protein
MQASPLPRWVRRLLYFGGAIMVLIERSAVGDATKRGHVGRNDFAARRPAAPQRAWKSVSRDLEKQTFPSAGLKDRKFFAANPKFFSALAANTNTEVPDRHDPVRRATPATVAAREQNEHGSHNE